MADQNAANCIRDCRDNAIFLCGARQTRVGAGKSFTVWQLCIFFATPQRLRKIKINCLLLNLLSKFYLHLNAFQRLALQTLCSLPYVRHPLLPLQLSSVLVVQENAMNAFAQMIKWSLPPAGRVIFETRAR